MGFGEVRMHESRGVGDIGLEESVRRGGVCESGTVGVEGGEVGFKLRVLDVHFVS